MWLKLKMLTGVEGFCFQGSGMVVYRRGEFSEGRVIRGAVFCGCEHGGADFFPARAVAVFAGAAQTEHVMPVAPSVGAEKRIDVGAKALQRHRCIKKGVFPTRFFSKRYSLGSCGLQWATLIWRNISLGHSKEGDCLKFFDDSSTSSIRYLKGFFLVPRRR